MAIYELTITLFLVVLGGLLGLWIALRSQINKLRAEQRELIEQVKQNREEAVITVPLATSDSGDTPIVADEENTVSTLLEKLREDVFLVQRLTAYTFGNTRDRRLAQIISGQMQQVEKRTEELLATISVEHKTTIERFKQLEQQLETHKLQLQEIMNSVGMFERVLAGPSLKGRLGERIVEQQLQLLPGEWISRNVRFSGGRVVEFGLRMPNGKLIPIDSKWTATPLLNLHGQQTDETIRRQLEERIRGEVITRAREVLKYLDKDRTLSFCIAAVPDAVFQICQPIQALLARSNVTLVSYSLLVPYIIMLVDFAYSNIQAVPLLQAGTALKRTFYELETLQQEIDTKIRGTFDKVQLQQSLHLRYNQSLQSLTQKMDRLEEDLLGLRTQVPTTLDPIDPSELSSIPKNLKARLDQLRERVASLNYDLE